MVESLLHHLTIILVVVAKQRMVEGRIDLALLVKFTLHFGFGRVDVLLLKLLSFSCIFNNIIATFLSMLE